MDGQKFLCWVQRSLVRCQLQHLTSEDRQKHVWKVTTTCVLSRCRPRSGRNLSVEWRPGPVLQESNHWLLMWKLRLRFWASKLKPTSYPPFVGGPSQVVVIRWTRSGQAPNNSTHLRRAARAPLVTCRACRCWRMCLSLLKVLVVLEGKNLVQTVCK